MSSVLLALATAFIASVSTLSGVALTHQYALRRWRDERADDRRIEQRDAAAELLDAAGHWSQSAVGVGTGIVGMRGDTMTMAGETQIFDRYEEPRKVMGHAVARAKLIITDESVAAAVADVAALFEASGQWFADVAETAKGAGGAGPSVEAFSMVSRFDAAREHAVAVLERAAVERFTTPVSGTRTRRRWWPRN